MERLLQINGAIRRNLLTGLIFVFVFCFHYFLLVAPRELGRLNQPNANPGAVTLKDVIRSSQLLVVGTGFVFAAGAVIDAMTDGFVVRGVSTSRSVHEWLSKKLVPQKGWQEILFNLLSFFIWPPVIVICTVLSSSDRYRLYRVGLQADAPKLIKENRISDAAMNIFKDTLSSNMRQGLDAPFCNQFDAAWQGLLAMLPEPQRQWAIGLSSRNRDLAAFLSSGFFALAISTGFLVSTGRLWSWAAGISYIFLCLLSWFLFGYVSLVIRSVLTALELYSVMSSSSIVR
jgi:hypothetical protein